MTEFVSRLQRMLTNLGWAGTLVYIGQRIRNRLGSRNTAYRLRSRFAAAPLCCRPGTSDLDVFHQIFIAREYRCLDDLADATFIVDCGANVGYSSAYFLTRFPNAFVIAIEPDRGNFQMLERNLAAYRGRYRAINSAVWSQGMRLTIAEERLSDGREWAVTVRESRPSDAFTMEAVALGDLLDQSPFDRISILKIDIEGAERELFASNFETWISRTDNLVIELHNPECEAAFYDAIAPQRFAVSRCDELTVCTLPPAPPEVGGTVQARR